MELTRQHTDRLHSFPRQTKLKENKILSARGSAKYKVMAKWKRDSPSGISFLNFFGSAEGWREGRENEALAVC